MKFRSNFISKISKIALKFLMKFIMLEVSGPKKRSTSSLFLSLNIPMLSSFSLTEPRSPNSFVNTAV